MTIRDTLTRARTELERSAVDTPFLDAMILLSHVLGLSKEKLLAMYPDTLPEDSGKSFETFLERRKSGVPIAYLTGEKEFFGAVFHVDERVLIPRPDTEVLVEAVSRILEREPRIRLLHDVCTGSGCIPVSLKLSFPDREISASDVSEAALEVFRLNCRRLLGVPLPHTRSDLLASVSGTFDMITANPPYVTREETDRIVAEGRREPRLALDGGIDGLDAVRKLAESSPESLSPGGYLVLEIAYDQADSVSDIVSGCGFTDINIKKDLEGRDRVVICRKGE